VINRAPDVPAPRSRSRQLLTIVVGLLFVLLLFGRWIATLWTDYLWYGSMGQTQIWRTLVLTRVGLVAVASIVAFGLFLLNLWVVDRLSPRGMIMPGTPDEELLERFQMWMEPRAWRVRLAASAFFGILIGLGAAAWQDDWLFFRHGGSFGVADPIFGHDVGLYVFQVPLFRDMFGWAFQLLLVLTLVVVAVHYLNGGIAVQRPSDRTNPAVKAHISLLLASLVLLKAVGYQLDKWDLLYSTRGRVFGASFTDVNAQIPALNLLIIISFVAAVILLVNLRFRGWTLPVVAVGLWLVTSIAVGGVYPALVQRFRVIPDEVNKEAAFVANNIEFTRDAYGLADTEVRTFAATSDLDAAALAANDATISNIRLWDPGVLEITYKQLQNIRTYYNIFDVDVDRYELDGRTTQVMLSARELQEDNLPESGWVNEHLVYTHGFGAILSRANDVTADGKPDLLIRDIPPENTSGDPDLDIDQPRIYFGDGATSRFLIVGTKEPEVDFPLGTGGDKVQRNSYDGAGGVPLGGILRRLAFSLRFGDLDTLISGQITSESRVLMVRNIRDRVGRLAPFMYADADPYVVLVDGRIKWVMDLYTLTDRYPYSTFADTSRLNRGPGLPNGFNYIRNSVKAVVDAFDGSVDLYVIDPTDPLVKANQRIFPGLYKPASELPDNLVPHLRYPEDLFRVQTDIYRLYHVTDPKQFFSNVDPWQIARDPSDSPRPDLRARFVDSSGKEYRPMLPYYLLMKLPGEDEISFLLMQPFTPRDRPNMVAFMVAKSGPLTEYGRKIEYSLPSDSQIDGPGQVGDFINQNPTISAEFTLLGQQGSEVIQGNMLVIPIEESLLYVQPIYIKASGSGGAESGIPQFKRVVVSYNGQIEIADSLDEAFAKIFGEAAPDQPGDGGSTEPPSGTVDEQVAELLTRAEAAFLDADAALRRGDLVTYAEKVEEARTAIEEANRLLLGVGTGA